MASTNTTNMSSESDGDGEEGEVPYFISLSNLVNKSELDLIIGNMRRSYYVTPCWKPDFYALLCYCGFVSVAQEPTWLIPELQKEYAVLIFNDLYLERNVLKGMKSGRFRLEVDKRPSEVYLKITQARDSNWLGEKYWAMMQSIRNGIQVGEGYFKPHTFELIDTETEELVAGEIGYSIGRTYTSLTGFYNPSYSSSGKVQICTMALFLASKGIEYISLGHAGMQYKLEFGGTIINRHDFLRLWNQSTSGRCEIIGSTTTAEMLPYYRKVKKAPAIADPTSKSQQKKLRKTQYYLEMKKKRKESKEMKKENTK